MNYNIKLTIIYLILSAIASCLASYMEGFYPNDIDIIILDLVWIAVIIWMITDLIKKKNILTSLYWILLICIFFAIVDHNEYGTTNALFCYITEVGMLIVSIITLRNIDKEYWIQTKS